MAESKWPRLSFENPNNWVRHAEILQADFDALHAYLESNGGKAVPKYLFKILYKSYCNFHVKLKEDVDDGNESASNEGTNGEGHQEGVTSTLVREPLGSGDQCGRNEGSTIRNNEHTAEKPRDMPDSTQKAEISNDTLSDEADTTISEVANIDEPAASNLGRHKHNACSLVVSVRDPMLIEYFSKLSATDLAREWNKALSSTNVSTDKGSRCDVAVEAEHLSNDKIRISTRDPAMLQEFRHNQLWKQSLLTTAKTAMTSYGVVASIFLNSTPDLDLKHIDDEIMRLVSENTPRLSTLGGPKDIRNLRWLLKRNKKWPKCSYLRIDYATAELANEVIKQGFAWKGHVLQCTRFVFKSEIKLCVNCLAYGHSADTCSGKSRCSKCGGPHISSTCSSTCSKCPACSAEHRPGPSCSKRQVELQNCRLAIIHQKPMWYVSGKPGMRSDTTDPLNHETRTASVSTERATQKARESNDKGSGSDSIATTSTETDSSDSTEVSDFESICKTQNEIQSRQDDVRVDIGAIAPSGPTGPSESDVSDYGSEIERGGEEVRREKEDPITESAAVTAADEQMSLGPTSKPEREDVSVNEGAAGQDLVQIIAVATASDVQIDVQGPEKVSAEPGVGTRHETKDNEIPVVANPKAAMSNVQTSSPAPENTLGSENKEEGEHEGREDSDSVHMKAAAAPISDQAGLPRPARTTEPDLERIGRHNENENHYHVQELTLSTAPLAAVRSDIDLDLTPLPEDTEAIIRQLDRLKAIVLARSVTSEGSARQFSGEKRKAPEPLGDVSGNPRIPKRVKHGEPMEDPVSVYIGENNCIPCGP